MPYKRQVLPLNNKVIAHGTGPINTANAGCNAR